MTKKGTREEKSEARRALRAVHQEMEELLEPPVKEYLKTIKTSEIVDAWLRARDTSGETPTPQINPQSGITFAEHRDKLERRNKKILTEFYKSNLQEWIAAWLADNADQTDHIKSECPMGIHHPSIAKCIDKISKRCAASQCRSISRLQQETDTDTNTVALFYRIAVQNQTQPVGSDEDIQVRHYQAVLQAREALQHIAINQLALGIWYGAVIRREPSIQLTNDHEILMLQACRDSGLTPQDWKAISKFNPNLIADTFHRYPPAAAATAWAALTDLPDPPAVAFINISAKQLANIRKQSNLSPGLFKPIIRAFYIHSIRYKTEGLSPAKLQAHAPHIGITAQPAGQRGSYQTGPNHKSRAAETEGLSRINHPPNRMERMAPTGQNPHGPNRHPAGTARRPHSPQLRSPVSPTTGPKGPR